MVLTDFASEPISGSDSAKDPIFSPVAILGNHRSFNWSEAHLNSVSPTREQCTVNKPTVELIRTVITTTATTYTLDKDIDDILLVDNTSTITLPTAVDIKGYHFVVKNIGDGATVTIDTTGSEKVDGEDTKIAPVRYTSLDLISDGSNWFIL